MSVLLLFFFSPSSYSPRKECPYVVRRCRSGETSPPQLQGRTRRFSLSSFIHDFFLRERKKQRRNFFLVDNATYPTHCATSLSLSLSGLPFLLWHSRSPSLETGESPGHAYTHQLGTWKTKYRPTWLYTSLAPDTHE